MKSSLALIALVCASAIAAPYDDVTDPSKFTKDIFDDLQIQGLVPPKENQPNEVTIFDEVTSAEITPTETSETNAKDEDHEISIEERADDSNNTELMTDSVEDSYNLTKRESGDGLMDGLSVDLVPPKADYYWSDQFVDVETTIPPEVITTPEPPPPPPMPHHHGMGY